MADGTKIEWTDATVNFWWGCTKVGPGCDHCYAETWARRTGGDLWGQGVPRRKIKGAVKLLHRLDNAYADWAADSCCWPHLNIPIRRRVFIQSMSDLFDLEVPLDWFAEAWGRIEVCNRLAIQILTKRVSVIEKRLAAIGRTTWPRHAGLMITVVNQDEADRDRPRLLALKQKLDIPWVGVSYEPALGPVDWTGWDFLSWLISGGESGPRARPSHPDWHRAARDFCAPRGIAYLMKQWGAWAPIPARNDLPGRPQMVQAGDCFVSREGRFHTIGRDLSSPLEGLGSEPMRRVGKKSAGRLLDGVEHNGFPEVRA